MLKFVFVFLISFVSMTFSAHADSIDGDWCSEDGRSLTIDGQDIRTPSGERVTGEYGRHSFRYIGPIGGPEEAHDVRMLLWSEDDMRIERIVDGAKQPVEMWRRCKPIA